MNTFFYSEVKIQAQKRRRLLDVSFNEMRQPAYSLTVRYHTGTIPTSAILVFAHKKDADYSTSLLMKCGSYLPSRFVTKQVLSAP